jgi:hypothetical protein
VGESPYLGRARFKANQRAAEGQIHAGTAQRVQVHSLRGGAPLSQGNQLQLDPAQRVAMDEELERKKREVSASECGH